MMNVLLVCALFALTNAEPQHGLPPDVVQAWKAVIEPHRMHCMEESGLEENKAGDMFEREHFPDERPFKCYIHCMQLKLNLMDSNGGLVIEEFKKYVPDVKDLEELQQIVKDEKDLCDKSYLLFIEAAKKVASNKKNTV